MEQTVVIARHRDAQGNQNDATGGSPVRSPSSNAGSPSLVNRKLRRDGVADSVDKVARLQLDRGKVEVVGLNDAKVAFDVSEVL